MRAFCVILALGALTASAPVEARRYRYYLDINRAEEILAAVPLSAPIPENRWLSILGERKDQTFTVRPGDNLWTISSRGFGDPFLWRKLWQVNPDLANPHDISVGQTLSYRGNGQAGEWEIPVIRLVPGSTGMKDLESDQVVNVQYRNQLRPPLMVLEEDAFLGEITAAVTPQQFLSYTSKAFIKGTGDHPTPTSGKFTVVRVEGGFHDSTRFISPYLGILTRRVADIEVVDENEGIAKVVITHQSERIQRGDRLIALVPAVTSLPVFNPPDDMEVNIVRGDTDERRAFAQGQIVLLNKGEEHGVKPGFLFRAIEEEDPFTQSGRGMLADYKGEVQVFHVDKRSCVAVVTKSQDPLLTGDRLLAAQLFVNPPPPPRRALEEIELN